MTPQDPIHIPLQKVSWKGRMRMQMRFAKVSLGMFLQRVFQKPLMTALVGAAFTLVVVGGGWQGAQLVYANDRIIRGDLLYPIKQVMENRQLSAVTNHASRSSFYLFLSHRRFAEGQEALTRESVLSWNMVPEAVAQQTHPVRLKNSLAGALFSESSQMASLSLKEAQKIKDKQASQQTLQSITQQLAQQQQALEEIKAQEHDDEFDSILEAIGMVREGNRSAIEQALAQLEDDPDELVELIFEAHELAIEAEEEAEEFIGEFLEDVGFFSEHHHEDFEDEPDHYEDEDYFHFEEWFDDEEFHEDDEFHFDAQEEELFVDEEAGLDEFFDEDAEEFFLEEEEAFDGELAEEFFEEDEDLEAFLLDSFPEEDDEEDFLAEDEHVWDGEEDPSFFFHEEEDPHEEDVLENVFDHEEDVFDPSNEDIEALLMEALEEDEGEDFFEEEEFLDEIY